MNKKFSILLFLVLVMLSCANFKNRTLYIYNWDDYINPDLVVKFEKQFNCKVQIDTYSSLEELSNVLSTNEKIYDLILPSNQITRQLYENKLVQRIDHSQIPNLKNMDVNFIKLTTDTTMTYSVPYMSSFTGIAYNKNKVTNFRPSWKMFSRPDLAGKIALLNDEREVIGAASKVLGYSYNGSDDIQLRNASGVISEWRKNQVKFDDNRALEQGLISGQFDLIQDYNGDALALMEEHPEIGFALPEEGVAINLDSFAIPSSSTNTKLAHAFINFFLEAENAKENMLYISYIAPNTAAKALLPKEFLGDTIINPPQQIMLKSEYIVYLGEDGDKYAQLWGTMHKR